jgi:hypothetical protein
MYKKILVHLDGSYQKTSRSVAACLLQKSNYPVMIIRDDNNDVI